MFADVIIDIQHEKLDKIFQYRIPERLEHEVEAGMAVVSYLSEKETVRQKDM